MTTSVKFIGAVLPNDEVTDVVVTGGRISAMGPGLSHIEGEVVDVTGLRLLPGLVDLHTHLREPGFESSETVLTGTQAAAVGGFTTVFAMANTLPVADTTSVVELVWRRGIEAGYATVRPVGAVTVGLEGQALADLASMASSRANVRVFSDDGKCVFDPLLMRRALEYVKAFDGVIAQHAQEPRLTLGSQMNEGLVSARLGLAGWPRVAEEIIIARDILLAEETGSRLHVCHLSTAGSVEIVRSAKARGVRVTAEVTPHHLLLTEESALDYDARFKVNPPLRTDEDVHAVRAGLADGTVDIVATDHAPHPIENKDCEWSDAAFGMVGLESALSIVNMTMVQSGLMSWNDVARVMSTAPAHIGGVANTAGTLEVGRPADLVFVDERVLRSFGVEDLAGLSKNSPFLGLELPGKVVHTMRHGYFTVRDGSLVDQRVIATFAREDTIGFDERG
ncbi:MAG: dihydroorotase [Microbacteriaceae bacterium]|jgi:dihydroorotase